jgi:hypothetical protein
MKKPSPFEGWEPDTQWMPFVLRISETPWGNLYWIESHDGRVVYRGRIREQNLSRQMDVLEFLLDWAAEKKLRKDRSRWLRWGPVGHVQN